tara:strand:- start:3823 stop:4167 length:345 start_codon:yes stop_codon:yes gene_type:complete
LGSVNPLFPVPTRIVKALQDNAHQKDYLPVKGLYQLRKEISSFFNRNYGLLSTFDDVMIGPGSKELIYNFQVAYNIEELLLPSPSWVSYEFALKRMVMLSTVNGKFAGQLNGTV